jgi:O-antigen/teichoic acid export membrane protein
MVRGDAVTTTTLQASIRRNGLLQIVGRLGWGVGDQAVSSLSNFALGVYVARTFGASSFGAFTLAYVTYSVVLNAARGLATDPLLVRYSGAAPERWRRAVSASSATALTVGVVIGLVCVVAGLLLPRPVGPVFVALGAGLPGLMLQDSWRFAFFAQGRGFRALLNDLVWTVLLILALVAMHYIGGGDPARCLLAFGGTASVAAILGAVQTGILPEPARIAGWISEHRQLSLRYMTENVSSSGASQIRAFVLGGVASLVAVGQVRAAEILMGPFLVVLMGVSQVAVPEASRVLHRAPHRLARFCLALGGVQAAAALAWGLVIMVALPLGVGDLLLRELWRPADHLLPAVMLSVMAGCFSTAATSGLRAMGVARRSLRAQLSASVLYLIGGLGGAVFWGAPGTCWGVALAGGLGTLVWWHQLRAALKHLDDEEISP